MLRVTLCCLHQEAFVGTLHYKAVMALRATKLTANYAVYVYIGFKADCVDGDDALI